MSEFEIVDLVPQEATAEQSFKKPAEIFIDIETLPGEEMPSIEDLKARAPGNLKKAETIQKWAEENQDAEWRKQALDSMTGRLLCIGFALDDQPPQTLTLGLDADTEKDLLQQFLAKIRTYSPVTWIGHNVRAFDLPWIWRAALKHGVYELAAKIPRRRYAQEIFDTMEIWGADYRDRVSLVRIAEFLDLGGKCGGLDGSKVLDAWQEGRLEEIAGYCAGDVELTRSIYQVITGRAD